MARQVKLITRVDRADRIIAGHCASCKLPIEKGATVNRCDDPTTTQMWVWHLTCPEPKAVTKVRKRYGFGENRSEREHLAHARAEMLKLIQAEFPNRTPAQHQEMADQAMGEVLELRNSERGDELIASVTNEERRHWHEATDCPHGFFCSNEKPCVQTKCQVCR